MTERMEVYKCGKCGNIVEVLHAGGGTLVCCGEDMTLMEVKTDVQEGKEKHVPVVEKTDSGVRVKVGSVPHPMLDEHYIEWIQVVTNSKVLRKFLEPGEAPEAEFDALFREQREIETEMLSSMEYYGVVGAFEGASS
jgi:superoxide reductase